MSIPAIQEQIVNIVEKADRINIEGLTAESDKDPDVPTYNGNGITETPDSTLRTINVYGVTEEAEWNPNCESLNIEGLTDDIDANDDLPWYQCYGVDGHTIHAFLEANYDYPIHKLGRQLPALVTLYNGFTQDYEAKKQTGTTYNFENTLYLPAQGRNLVQEWEDTIMIIEKIIARFRLKPGLNDTCWGSIVRAGEPVISAAEKPKWIGHTFALEAQKVERGR